MSNLKIIKSENEHNQAVERLMSLMDMDPTAGTVEENELEVLSVLIEQYEKVQFPIDKPEPIEAIKFRMDQMGLVQKDMIEFFGSASKTSEVLNGKRPLSISMIRKLYNGLGIPADILIQESNIAKEIEEGLDSDIDWQAYPLKDMQKYGYFGELNYTASKLKEYAEDLVRNFQRSVPGCENMIPAMMRTSAHLINNDKKVNNYALSAWQIKVLKGACEQKDIAKYKKGSVDITFMQRLAKSSWSDHGPELAKEYLYKHGIHLIIEPHLDKTYLDGGVCISPQGTPIVALTLRHDRLDNYWFTLMHELAHIALHLDGEYSWFIDDLDVETNDLKEDEANAMAREALIPTESWLLNATSSLVEMRELANRLEISPSIVYGRFAREYDKWKSLRKYIPKVKELLISH